MMAHYLLEHYLCNLSILKLYFTELGGQVRKNKNRKNNNMASLSKRHNTDTIVHTQERPPSVAGLHCIV